MTLNEAVYQVLEIVAPNRADDDIVDTRLIKALINTKRAHFINNELNKNRAISPILVQELNCVSLEEVDDAECCDFTSGCSVLRTAQEIPTPINLHHRVAIERVGPPSIGQPAFSFMSYSDAIYFGNGRYNKRGIAAYYRDGRIYIASKSDLGLMDTVSIRGVFEDPSSAADFINCTGDPCFSDDDKYPIDQRTWDYVKEDLVTKDMMRILQMPVDLENDAINEKTGAGAPNQSKSV